MDLKRHKQAIDAEADELSAIWKIVLRTTYQSITAIVPSFQTGPSPVAGRSGFTVMDARSSAKWGVAARGKQVCLYRYDPPVPDPIRPNFWHGPNVSTATSDWWLDSDRVRARQDLEQLIYQSFLDWYKHLGSE